MGTVIGILLALAVGVAGGYYFRAKIEALIVAVTAVKKSL
jgi:uncharacterized protein YneF (UPF0154 family)